MALDSRRSEPLAEKASTIENLLVLRRFRDAENASVELLQSSAYLPKSQTIQQRAAHVYVQAMYEQERTQDGLATLMEHYGSLEALDFDVFMLWVALALDAGLAREASSKLHQYILLRSSDANASYSGLTPVQYEAAARMYALEALAGELGHAKEAERWLKEQTPWLGASQRQSIIEDLQQSLQGQDSAGQQFSLRAPSPALQEDKVSWAAPKISKVTEHVHSWEPGEPSSSSAAKHGAAPAGASMSVREQPSAAGPKPAAPTQSARAGEVPEQASSSGTARLWASYVPQGLREMMSSLQEGEGVAGLSRTQAVAAAAGALVLLYAGMAERRAVYAGVKSIGSGVWTSIAEVARVAFQLNPNPVAASMGGRRY